MRFKKGQSGNPAGRKPGAVNKVSRPVKELLSDFMMDKVQELPQIWEKLSPRDRAGLIKDMLPFFLPKLSTVNMDAEINFNTMTESEIDAIALKLINNKHETND